MIDVARLRGLRALLVEDESMVAMLVETMLLDHEVDVFVAMRLADAIAAVESRTFDFAILDVNLGGGDRSDAVADILHARSVPFLFAIGYGARGLADRFRTVPTVQKPFKQQDLFAVLGQVLSR